MFGFKKAKEPTFIAGPFHTNRHMKRSQYAVPSRSKPENRPRRPEIRNRAILAGKTKLEAFLSRGYHLNKRRVSIKQNPVTSGIRRALGGA